MSVFTPRHVGGGGVSVSQRGIHSASMRERSGRPLSRLPVDHIVPHKGDQLLFFDQANWQALCPPATTCRKQRSSDHGYDSMPNADGSVLRPAHPFNKPQGRGGL